MHMQKKMPITHEQIQSLAHEESRKLLQQLGLRVRETGSIPPQRMRGPRRRPYPGDPNAVTFGGITWAQRMRNWRKDAYKKKDEQGRYRYRWTQWPICETWCTEPQYQYSCNLMSQEYFGRDFDWDMAVEADTLGWQEEQAARSQAETRGIPADERARRWNRPEIRSTQAGGAETRPRVGTIAEAKALAAIRQPTHKGAGKVRFGGAETFDI